MKKIVIIFSLLLSFGISFSQQLVEDIWPGSTSSSPNTFYGINGDIYFLAQPEAFKSTLYKLDGTSGNLISVTPNLIVIQILGNIGNQLLFVGIEEANGNQQSIYKTDGTLGSYDFIKTYPEWDDPDVFYTSGLSMNYSMNGILYFWGFTENTGQELMRTDGTEAGTYIVKDIFPGENGSLNTFAMTSSFYGERNNTLYFNAMHPDYGSELWKTDGTEAGTVLVKDIEPTPVFEDLYFIGGSPGEFANYKNSIYFTALNPNDQRRIFKTDGTESGTVLAMDNISSAAYLKSHNGSLYFIGDDENNGTSTLYKSDGTQSGTQMVKNPNQGGPTSVVGKALTVFNNKIYFVATHPTTWVSSLWQTDGTAEGTIAIPNAPSMEYFPFNLYATSDYLYFFGIIGNGNTALFRLGKNSNSIEQISDNGFECNPLEIIMNNDGCLILTGYYGDEYNEEVYKICDQDTNPLAVEKEEISTLSVFPNPSREQITITNINSDKIENIQLYNSTGQTSNLGYSIKNINEIQIRGLSSYSKGIYLLSISMKNGERQTTRLIIE